MFNAGKGCGKSFETNASTLLRPWKDVRYASFWTVNVGKAKFGGDTDSVPVLPHRCVYCTEAGGYLNHNIVVHATVMQYAALTKCYHPNMFS
jgi:hypothetical protein